MTRDLKEKAIDIKGKKYVMVKDRIKYFNETYKEGSITTEIASDDGKEIIFKATIRPDSSNKDHRYTGFASGVRGGAGVDSTAAVENGETSAVGRALAMMGIGVIDSIASVDEINKAKRPVQNMVEGMKPTKTGKCENCGERISQKVVDYSMGKFGKALCYDCQRSA